MRVHLVHLPIRETTTTRHVHSYVHWWWWWDWGGDEVFMGSNLVSTLWAELNLLSHRLIDGRNRWTRNLLIHWRYHRHLCEVRLEMMLWRHGCMELRMLLLVEFLLLLEKLMELLEDCWVLLLEARWRLERRLRLLNRSSSSLLLLLGIQMVRLESWVSSRWILSPFFYLIFYEIRQEVSYCTSACRSIFFWLLGPYPASKYAWWWLLPETWLLLYISLLLKLIKLVLLWGVLRICEIRQRWCSKTPSSSSAKVNIVACMNGHSGEVSWR